MEEPGCLENGWKAVRAFGIAETWQEIGKEGEDIEGIQSLQPEGLGINVRSCCI